MTRGRRGSLPPRRRALPSPPPCRFIPALSPDPGPRRQVHQHVRCRVRQRRPTYPAHPVRAPQANAIAERWIGTARRELLDRMLILNRRHLMAVLTQYVAHFNDHRPHRALNQAAPLRSLPPPAAPSQLHVRRRDLLDGLIHEYTPSHDVDDQFGTHRATSTDRLRTRPRRRYRRLGSAQRHIPHKAHPDHHPLIPDYARESATVACVATMPGIRPVTVEPTQAVTASAAGKSHREALRCL